MISETMYGVECGIPVGGKKVNMIMFADDKAVVASRKTELQQLMDNLNRVIKEGTL